MTEIERWLNTYGKAPTTQQNKNTKSQINKDEDFDKRIKDINQSIKEMLKRDNRTPEEIRNSRIQTIPSDYHPGMHTRSRTFPTLTSKELIKQEVDEIKFFGGKVVNIEKYYYPDTMNAYFLYEMPDWDTMIAYMLENTNWFKKTE
jgi:hypothetical protein